MRRVCEVMSESRQQEHGIGHGTQRIMTRTELDLSE